MLCCVCLEVSGSSYVSILIWYDFLLCFRYLSCEVLLEFSHAWIINVHLQRFNAISLIQMSKYLVVMFSFVQKISFDTSTVPRGHKDVQHVPLRRLFRTRDVANRCLGNHSGKKKDNVLVPPRDGYGTSIWNDPRTLQL